jgi:hypothetical protein
MDGNTRGIYPRPLTSASQSQSTFHLNTLYSSPHQKGVFEGCEDAVGMQQSSDPFMDQEKRPTTQRDCFLGERFPGDMSHRPLELLRKQTKAADRSSHLKKKHIPDTDLVDSLDNTVMGMVYHHGGPYDATLLARNTDYLSSPVAAVSETNAEALKATPKECIRDSLRNHVPLQGTAVIPPGTRDFSGCEMRYEEGSDLMREDGEGGAYKRWPGIVSDFRHKISVSVS